MTRKQHSGAALLTAMLTVTLVATFAASAIWQQWRAAEVEGAERARIQAGWVLVGALDWSRLIMREDARAGGPDSLSEPWAVPLAEAKLTTFLAADKNVSSDSLEGLPEAYLSGRIIDAQSKLNVLDLVDHGTPVTTSVATFNKLFQLLGLPAQELSLMVQNLQQALPANAAVPDLAGTASAASDATAAAAAAAASGASASATTAAATSAAATAATAAAAAAAAATASANSSASAAGPLFPQRESELGWLGLSPSTVAALEPYVTVLPVFTPLNLNTASAEAIFASMPALDMASAQRLVAARAQSAFKTLEAASALVPQGGTVFNPTQHSVSSRFFEVRARLRI
ncbi:MAG TPA: type II secretion system minor pseudopilin GspK, partial [Variovorax sp.]